MSARHEEVVATKAWDTALFKRLVGFARPHARLFAVSFLLLAVLFALELAGPWILHEAIDGPVRDAELARVASDGGQFDTSPYLRELGLWAALYLVVVAVGALVQYVHAKQLAFTGQTVIHDLRTQLFRHVHSLEVAWFDRRPTGALVTRVTSDVENLNELFTSGLVVLLFDLIKIGVIFVLLFLVDVRLATVVLVLTPVLILLSLVFRGGARRAHRKVRARLARLNGFLQEVLSGVRIVQMFQREERVSRRFHDDVESYYKANLRTIFLFALFYPCIGFAVTVIQGSIVWTGGDSIAAGTLTFGEFILFWWWLQKLVGPIREMGERYNVLQSAFASAERIFEVLDTSPRIASPARPTPPAEPFRAHVRFEDVSFAYDPNAERQIVKNISFDIAPGQTVALVGATGAGKSTLVQLLMRFRDPLRGRVTIDGQDLRELDLAAYRRHVGLVLQEDFLFSGTVRDNLLLGRDDIGDEALARALQSSAADTVVERLPDGLDAEVTERGESLSTGERELIAIARALAGGPQLVVLDEATSSVDSTTEARIEAATHALLRGKSALVVAHRLSTIRRADKILVMHHGEIREQGTHAELLKAGGLYARLYELQFKDAV